MFQQQPKMFSIEILIYTSTATNIIYRSTSQNVLSSEMNKYQRESVVECIYLVSEKSGNYFYSKNFIEISVTALWT